MGPFRLLAAALLVALPISALADGEGAKPVIVRAHGDALVLWDATSVVAQVVRDKAGDDDANARLQRGALKALVETVPHLQDAKRITVRVLYNRTGEVSPVYNAATFAGVERYATLEISGTDARSDKEKWKEAAMSSGPATTLPHSITFTIIGKLPPR